MLPLATLLLATSIQGVPESAQMPLAFVQNRGQWSEQAKFLARTPNANLWVTDYGLSLDMFDSANGVTRGHVVQIAFDGGQLGKAAGKTLLKGVENYLGADGTSTLGVPRFAESGVTGVYPGVDARYYFDGATPRYDLIVRPGADASRIKMRYVGAKNVRVGSDGELRYDTSLGTVVERGLYAYQRLAGGTRPVAARPVVTADGGVTFRLGTYDKSQPLIIDPKIERSTTLTGSSMTVAGIGYHSGASFVAGSSNSATLRTAGAYVTTGTPTAAYSYVRKEDSSGNVVWATYVGNGLLAADLAIDSQGRAVVVGTTASNSGFVATGPQTSNGSFGGATDGYGFRLSADGTTLNWGSYFGTVQAESATGVSIGANDDIYICGTGNSNNWDVNGTSNVGFDNTQNSGTDAWVVRINATTSTTLGGTFLGAANNDGANDVIYDAATNTVYVGGYAGGSSFPGGSSGTYGTFGGGTSDGFVARMTQDLSGLTSRRFYGATGSGAINRIAVSSTAVLAGGVSGTSPNTNGLVAQTNLDLSISTFSTALSGAGNDSVTDVAFDSNGQAVFVGNTNSSDFPVTSGALDTTYDAPQDGFFGRLTTSGTIQYASYFGNSGTDSLSAIGASNGDELFIGGVDNGGLAVFADVNMAPQAGGSSLSVTSAQPFYGSTGRDLTLSGTVDIASATERTVPITSSNPAVIASGNLVIPAGSTSGTATLASKEVFYDTTVTLTFGTQTLDVVVKAPNTSTVVVGNGANPLTSVGGVRLSGVISLATAAGTGGQWVKRTIVEAGTTTSRDKTWAGVTTNFFFPAGTSSLPFQISLSPTTTQRDIQLFSAGGSTGVRSNTVRIVPMAVSSLTVNSATVPGGRYAFVTATLSAPAPAGGTVVDLTSSVPGVLPIPATMTIAAGTVSNKIAVLASAVASDTSVTLGASYNGGAVVNRSLTVSAPTVQSLVLNRTSVQPGERIYGYVQLNAAAPTGGLNVTVSVPQASGVHYFQETGVTSKSFSIAAGAKFGPLPRFILQVPSSATGSTFPVKVTLNGVETTVTVTVG